MTKQIQFTQTGSPDVLQIVDVQIPAPKSGEVQIQMHALGLKAKIIITSFKYTYTSV